MRDLAPCCICGCSERDIKYRETSQSSDELRALGPYSGHYRINVCKGCGLIYSSPILDEREVNELYTEYSEANVAHKEIQNVRATMKGYYDLARPFIQQRERALDIGCDIGLLLEAMREDGFKELHGLEPVAVARDQAVKRVAAAKISGDFYENTKFAKDSFDMITLIHVVDHLVHPNNVVDRVYANLRPGGICIAVVHNVESQLARLMGERFPVFNYFHHYFFSKRTLTALFAGRGFEVLRVTPTRNRYSLAFFIERTPFLPVSLRQSIARLSHRLGVGHISLSISVGNIGIVARKPQTAKAA